MPAYSFDLITNGYRRFFLFLFTTSEPANLEIFFQFFFDFGEISFGNFFLGLDFGCFFEPSFHQIKDFS